MTRWTGKRTFLVPIYPSFIRELHIHNFLTMLLNPLNAELNPICYLLALLEAHHFLHVSRIRVKYAGTPYCWETALVAPSYCDNRRSIFRAWQSIYRFSHILLPLRRDGNLSVPTTRLLSLAINKAAASLLLLLVTMLFTSFSSIKCMESLFPHFVTAWQHRREEQVCAWPKMRCFQREINSGSAPHALNP